MFFNTAIASEIS